VNQPVFLSYATADRAQALSVCEALEARGIACWIASRDVAPGENYQEAIVQALRCARAMVLVFSAAANDSDEIKKELSLASRFRVPVMAVRMEDVAPSDAFAYELSTRQWINAFEGWDRAIDALAGRIGQLSGDAPGPAPGRAAKPFALRRPAALAGAGLLAAVLAAGAWWGLQATAPAPAAAAHGMTVRLAGFQLLSADLPATVPATVDAEIAAAFNADGVVGVSTAAAAAPGEGPAYALGGTIQRDGDAIRVITRLTNERSGATVWGDSFNYDGAAVARVPRRIAVDAGNVVRCGLFGASTYDKPLPDTVLKDYMQFCQGHWDVSLREGRKALLPAQRVVAAVPDFSWGWAAVAGGYWKIASNAETPEAAEAARAAGREAADRAVEIDPKNSEAFYIKAMLVNRQDWGTREALFQRAIAAQRLDCGCEYHQYGWLLLNVGRVNEAVERLRQASDMLALYLYTALNLADALVVAGHFEEAAAVYDAAIDLAPDAAYAARILTWKATRTWDAAALSDPQVPFPPALRAALVQGRVAMDSGDAAAKAEAVKALLALPPDQQTEAAARLLGALGAAHAAFQMAAPLAAKNYPGPTLFWYPAMRATLDDPGFPDLADQLGLMTYWKATGTKPDVCSEAAPPAFCGMI
jgi:tetratricopeptide (TPR) repeat protein